MPLEAVRPPPLPRPQSPIPAFPRHPLRSRSMIAPCLAAAEELLRLEVPCQFRHPRFLLSMDGTQL